MTRRLGWMVGWLLMLGAAPVPGAAPVSTGGRPAPMRAATAIVAVEAAVRPDAVAVTIRGDGALTPAGVRRFDHFRPRLVVDFAGLAAEAAPARRVEVDPVDRMRVDRRSVESTRVVIELSRAAPYRVESGDPAGAALTVVFPRDPTRPKAAGERSTGRMPSTPSPTRPAAGSELSILRIPPPRAATRSPTRPAADAGSPPGIRTGPRPGRAGSRQRFEGPPGTRTGPPPGAAAGAPLRVAQPPGQPSGGEPAYTGDPVSMDFQNADLRAVLRVFAEITDLNIVIDPSVRGEVNVALTQVPWDQAFDVILRANGLGYEIDGPVVRIASIRRLQQEAEERAVLAQREAEAGELLVFTRTLSYARADDLVPLLTGASLSARGEVFTDPRTNTLIVRDLADRLPAIDVLLDTLDRSQPQVEIEARVVRAGHDSARALGVQWGLGGRGAAGRGEQGTSGDEASTGADGRLATGIDLGVGAPTSTLGVALGEAVGPLDLDVTLSALESRGELRIISSPRVTTQNNVQAEILQGDQIPYQTVANNTVTVEFKEAALTLRVTPQITAAGTVIMQVEVENSFADFARALGNPPIPSIVTQRAATTVHVGDGETAVIGGIYENTRSEQRSRTPGLHRVPVLGWLFRSAAGQESTDELMIFLTPRIVRR